MPWEPIVEAIGAAREVPFTLARHTSLAGGCINAAHRLEGADGTCYFVKTNAAHEVAMFAAERAGLEALAATGTIRVPRPLLHGVAGDQAYLVLEYIELGSAGDPAAMGRQLAALHRAPVERFGWTQDNTIGSTPQANPWEDDWITFYREHRLRPQFALAATHGYGLRGEDALYARLPELFPAGPPRPSLLHGDLWGGNAAFAENGDPVIFDPAPYHGDREADLAMTRLFGGFGPAFYEAYTAAWPLPAGHERRVTLYNLYHILNHAHLFGASYAAQAQRMIDGLLA